MACDFCPCRTRICIRRILVFEKQKAMVELFTIDGLLHIIFWVLACFFNSVMDVTENENFSESIIKKWNTRFWYKRDSDDFARKIFTYKVDAWHLSKSLMIICFAIAAYFAPRDTTLIPFLIMDGILWNVFFYLFYHKLFGAK